MDPPAEEKPKSVRLSFLSPRTSRSGSLSSGFAGPLSPHGASPRVHPSGAGPRRMSMSVLVVQETVLRKHLAVLMTAQTTPDVLVPLFLVSVTRFFRDRGAGVPGLLDPLSPAEKAQAEKVFTEAVPGSEYVFAASLHARVVFQVFLTFLRSIPLPCIVTFEVRPLLRALIPAKQAASLGGIVGLFQALPSLNRQVLLEVLHIVGLICENSHVNLCDPLRVCSAFAGVCFAEHYSALDDEASFAASDESRLFLRMVTLRRELLVALEAAPFAGQSSYDLLWGLSSTFEFEAGRERVGDLAFCASGDLCVVGSSGTVRLRSPSFEPRATAAARQPLMHVAPVEFSFWVRGEMCAEIRSGVTGERVTKLSRNVRCFLHLPQLKRVWGGSEGLIYVFDDTTGADAGSIVFSAAPSTGAGTSATALGPVAPGHSMLKRQESEMVDDEVLSGMLSSLAQPLTSTGPGVRHGTLSTSTLTSGSPGAAPIASPRSVSPRLGRAPGEPEVSVLVDNVPCRTPGPVEVNG
jgi:hypothetical protein